MAQHSWRKAGVFEGTIDPFPTQQPTHMCSKCGHLTLYSIISSTTNCSHCNNTKSNNNIAPLRTSVNLSTKNKTSIYDTKPPQKRNTHSPRRKTPPHYNKNLPKTPPHGPHHKKHKKSQKKRKTKSHHHNNNKGKPKPLTNTVQRHELQNNVNRRNNSKQRQQKFNDLMQKQFNPNFRKKPMPPSNDTSSTRINKTPIQNQNYNQYNGSKPPLRKVHSARDIRSNKPQNRIQSGYKQKGSMPRDNPVLNKAGSDTDKLYNAPQQMKTTPSLRRTQSETSKKEKKEKKQNDRSYRYNRYPHRGPPIDFATFLQ